MYEVTLDQFSGPLEKLLELIEARELDVKEVSLAEVTDDFIGYLKERGNVLDASLLADFLVVAAKLVLIKSKAILPDLELTEDEEHDIKDLEARLLIYRDFAARGGEASAALMALWERKRIAEARPLLAGIAEGSFFYPAPNLTRDALVSAAEETLRELRELMPEAGTVKNIIVSIEEKIRELMERCKQVVSASFRKLAENRPKAEVVAMFLAVLHLLKGRSIEVEQKVQFGDIMLKNSEGKEANHSMHGTGE